MTEAAEGNPIEVDNGGAKSHADNLRAGPIPAIIPRPFGRLAQLARAPR